MKHKYMLIADPKGKVLKNSLGKKVYICQYCGQRTVNQNTEDCALKAMSGVLVNRFKKGYITHWNQYISTNINETIKRKKQ